MSTKAARRLPALFQGSALAGWRWPLVIVGAAGLYAVLAPSTTPVTPLGMYNEKRLFQVTLLGVSAISLLSSRSTRQRWLSMFWAFPRPARLGLLLVLGLGLFSALSAPAPLYAALEVGHFVLLFFLAGIIATVYRQFPTSTSALVLGAVVLSAFLYAVHFSVSYGMSVALPALEIGAETLGGFGNVRFFNQYQTWTLPLLAVPVLALSRRWDLVRAGTFLLLVMWWTLVLASNVRGTVLAMTVAVLGVGLLFRRRALKWVGVQGAALLAGIGLYYLLFSTGGAESAPVAGRVDETVGYSRRIRHWMICLDMAMAHPWLGAGPMHFAWPPINFKWVAHPHNALMQWIGEWGIPSTLILLGLACWGGWCWIRQEVKNPERTTDDTDALQVGLVAAALAGLAHAMVSGIIVMPVSQVLFAMVGGWAWGRYQRDSRAFSKEGASTWAHALLCAVLVASMFAVGNSLQDLADAEERRAAYRENVDRDLMSPRYWAQGYIGVRDSSVVQRARREME